MAAKDGLLNLGGNELAVVVLTETLIIGDR